MSLAVAATLSPRFKNASAHSLPNPREAPVIKNTLGLITASPFSLVFISRDIKVLNKPVNAFLVICLLAYLFKCSTHFFGKKLGLLPLGKVTALVYFIEINKIMITTLS